MSRLISMIVVLVAGFMGWQNMDSGSVEVVHYPDGSIWRETHYDRNGKLHGKLLEYFPDGTLSQESHFVHGSWTQAVHYNNHGRKIHESTDEGSERVWDEDGVETKLR